MSQERKTHLYEQEHIEEDIQYFDNGMGGFVYFGRIPEQKITSTFTGQAFHANQTLESRYHSGIVEKRQGVIERNREMGNRVFDSQGKEVTNDSIFNPETESPTLFIKDTDGNMHHILYDSPLPRVRYLRATKNHHASINYDIATYFQHKGLSFTDVQRFGGRVDSPQYWKMDGTVWTENTHPNNANSGGPMTGLVIENGKWIVLMNPRAASDEDFLIKGPGGYSSALDKNGNPTKELHEVTGVENPATSAIREIEEETGIKQEEIQDFSLRGRAVEPRVGLPATTLIFTGKAPTITREELLKRERDKEDNLFFIPNTTEARRKAALQFSEISQGYIPGILMAIAIDEEGISEAQYINGRLARRATVYDQLPPEKRRQIFNKQAKRLSPDRISNTVFDSEQNIRIENAAQNALRCAGQKVQELLESGKALETLETNQFGDTALAADIEAEKAVIESLRDSGLPLRIISEEHGEVDLVDEPTMLAVLDGIDGSKAFAEGEESATMLAIFPKRDPTYSDAVFAGVIDPRSGIMHYATKARGAFRRESDGTVTRINTSNRKRLTKQVKVCVDRGSDKMAGDYFQNKLPDRHLDSKQSSAAHFISLATGEADIVLEHTRKGNLEFATAYLLTKESGGVMVDANAKSIGGKKFLAWGQEDHLPVVAASTNNLAKAITKRLS